MASFKIIGGKKLKGDISPQGAKNEALQVLCATLLTKEIEIKTTFQSRFGPDEWLQPYTDKTLERLPKEGVKNVLAICPGFSSDCVETLEEILIQGKESFMEAGGENFDMISCLNDNDDHIKLINSLIKRNI